MDSSCRDCKERLNELNIDPRLQRGGKYNYSVCEACLNYYPEEHEEQVATVIIQPCDRDHDIDEVKGNLISLRDTLKQHVNETRKRQDDSY